ncbi:UPF0046 protein C25E10.12 [Hondaea fermentalgiana]|uniref:UPF0046 protein C25E10.12 n=1 Tax=Hondaea fermentalgiana TaxID=2315210 RepID=A0A2R5G2V7_9STRA|nr:UPF0046 protein C25E10.12 [Hondaea fermentalgiana]|eukprot:GBG25340.1 UPF0046 protein C25E10.12 [Hondaea fermentalgiana]
MASQPHRHRVLTAGNHDVIFDPDHAHAKECERRWSRGKPFCATDQLLAQAIDYLCDASVKLDGVKVYIFDL